MRRDLAERLFRKANNHFTRNRLQKATATCFQICQYFKVRLGLLLFPSTFAKASVDKIQLIFPLLFSSQFYSVTGWWSVFKS